MNTRALQEILVELRNRADLVLIDASPLLLAGAAMTLSTKVDGLLIVARLNVARRRTLAELGRVLARTPAAKLGLVVTGDTDESGYGFYTQSYRYTSRGKTPQQRVAP